MDILDDDVIAAISRRLTSGNSTQCESARITRDEWLCIMDALEGLDYEEGYIAKEVEKARPALSETEENDK